MDGLKRSIYIIGPLIVCVLLYWSALGAWFQQDDFWWLSLRDSIRGPADWGRVLFTPLAQGTIRPLSERLVFIAFTKLFGLNALPFHFLALLTELASLILLTRIVNGMTGHPLAGFCAAIFWCACSALAVPMTWASAYNQILCSFFILLAFHFMLLYLDTRRVRYYWLQAGAFVLGLGALEWAVAYPVLALTYALLCARRYVWRLSPLLGLSALYIVAHLNYAGAGQGVYRMHLNGELFSTLATYTRMAAKPALLSLPLLAIAIFTHLWKQPRAVFWAAWFFIAIGPALPLSGHIMPYYLTMPMIGFAVLAGWGVAEALRGNVWMRITTAFIAVSYLITASCATRQTVSWWTQRSLDAKRFTESVLAISRQARFKILVLDSISAETYWSAVHDDALRLWGYQRTYLAPGFSQMTDVAAQAAQHRILSPVWTSRLAREGRAIVVAYDGAHAEDVTERFARLHVEIQQRPPGAYDDLDWSIDFSGDWTRDLQFAQASSGTVTYSDDAGAWFSFPFEGQTVTWVYTAAYNRGKAAVTLDGFDQGTVDLYSLETRWQQRFCFRARQRGSHELRVRVLGEKRPESRGTYVDLDALLIQ